MSSYDWLSLSGLQLITDQPMEQVFASLELSMLTGPNEGYFMAERGLFGASLWERLPPDLQRRVAIDLAVGGNDGGPADLGGTCLSARPGFGRGSGSDDRNRAFAARRRSTAWTLRPLRALIRPPFGAKVVVQCNITC